MGPLERATADFGEAPSVIAAYVFGSVPEGRAHRESDLDLAVLLDWAAFPDRPSRAERQVELISDLIAATCREKIGLVILNGAPPLFGRQSSGSDVPGRATGGAAPASGSPRAPVH